MRFNDIKVGHKLRVGMLGALALAFMLSVGLNRYFASVEAELSRTLQVTNDNIELALRWQGLTELNVERAVLSTITVDISLAEMIGPRLKAGIAEIAEVQKRVEAAVKGTPQEPLVAEVAKRRAVVLASLAKVRTLKGEGDGDAAALVVNQTFLPAVKVYGESLADVVKSLHEHHDLAIAEAEAVRTRAIWISLLLAGGLVVVGVVLVETLVRSINEPLARSVRLAQAIADGNLMHVPQQDRHDEFGVLLHALDDMTTRLRSVVREVRAGVESTSTASAEIANGNLDLSGRTEQTASSLEQTAASMEQLTSAVTQSADVAKQANQLAATAVQAATQGGQIVSEAVISMQHITDSSRRIGDIIGVIDGIAFQTNILALNAAVEAARAGEQGRGFAVVAAEVRNLAQQSATAAREIKTLINASVDTVETGARQVGLAGQSMGEIVGSVRRVTDLIAEITAAASEQRDGIGQVSQAVTHLDQMTQQNAALVEQSAAAAASLRDQAQRLAEVVSVFQVDGQPA